MAQSGILLCGIEYIFLVWYGMVWYGMVWYGRYGMVWCATILKCLDILHTCLWEGEDFDEESIIWLPCNTPHTCRSKKMVT